MRKTGQNRVCGEEELIWEMPNLHRNIKYAVRYKNQFKREVQVKDIHWDKEYFSHDEH